MLVEDMCDSFSLLILGNEGHHIPCEVVHENQHIRDAQQLVELHGHLYAGKVDMNQL